jgi:pyrroline-5-carboxylate reductase
MAAAVVGFLGTGNMGGAIATGLSGRKDLNLTGFDPDSDRLEQLAAQTGLDPLPSAAELATGSDYLILAVKPQQLQPLLEDLAPRIRPEACLISIAAGIPLSKLRQWSGGVCPVVRIMPNTPALVGAGVFALCLDDPALSHEQKEFIEQLFRGLGEVHILPEKLFDPFTAVVGSGPAYVFYFMEALIESAVTMGIPRPAAISMVKSLFHGSVKLSAQSDHSLAELREMVCSPGGSTLAGLNHFDRTGLRGSIIDAVIEAWKRNLELGS